MCATLNEKMELLIKYDIICAFKVNIKANFYHPSTQNRFFSFKFFNSEIGWGCKSYINLFLHVTPKMRFKKKSALPKNWKSTSTAKNILSKSIFY
jgi:hypothetical protein